MTPAERLTARIAKNREIEEKLQSAPPVAAKSVRRKTSAERTATPSKNNTLDRYHEIRRLHGIDAASEYLEKLRATSDKMLG